MLCVFQAHDVIPTLFSELSSFEPSLVCCLYRVLPHSVERASGVPTVTPFGPILVWSRSRRTRNRLHHDERLASFTDTHFLFSPVENHPSLRRLARFPLEPLPAPSTRHPRARLRHLRPDSPGRRAPRAPLRPFRPALRVQAGASESRGEQVGRSHITCCPPNLWLLPSFFLCTSSLSPRTCFSLHLCTSITCNPRKPLEYDVYTPARRTSPKAQSRKGRGKATKSTPSGGEIHFRPLDWEVDVVTPALASSSPSSSSKTGSFDAIVACDCIYNEALIAPFVQTCADACRLREKETQRSDNGREQGGDSDGEFYDSNDDDDAEGGGGGRGPCVCLVAQQLRSSDVFEAWLREFHRYFRVWRVPDTMLTEEGLHVGTGFVVHVGILRGQGAR